MKKQVLTYSQMETLSGGLDKNGFCKGFGAAQVVYGAGVLLNAWNPIGWGGAAVALVIDGYCLI